MTETEKTRSVRIQEAKDLAAEMQKNADEKYPGKFRVTSVRGQITIKKKG